MTQSTKPNHTQMLIRLTESIVHHGTVHSNPSTRAEQHHVMANYLELTLQNAHLWLCFQKIHQRFLRSKSFRGNKFPSSVCSFHMSHMSPPYNPHRLYLQFWILRRCAQPMSLHPYLMPIKNENYLKKTKAMIQQLTKGLFNKLWIFAGYHVILPNKLYQVTPITI